MRTRHRFPVWIPPGAPPVFPNPLDFDESGLVAGGGDLTRDRLLSAYSHGIFPWYDEPPILWWSPDPRAVISLESLHVSRSLRRTLRTTKLSVTRNRDFKGVMDGCADRSEGTWLTREMSDAYLDLHRQNHADSYEVWDAERLVGGLYGVRIGGFFAAESKFHRVTDASKLALVCAVVDLFTRGVQLLDVQFLTPHLRTLGVHEISRESYLRRLHAACSKELPASEQDSSPLLVQARAALKIG